MIEYIAEYNSINNMHGINLLGAGTHCDDVNIFIYQ